MKVFSIMVTWSLESAIDTADSMRSRGYGCAKRTSFQRYAMTGTDWLLLALEIALPVLVLAFGDAEAAYTPDLYIAPLRGLPVLGFAAYAAFLLIPTVLHIKETVQWNILISRI